MTRPCHPCIIEHYRPTSEQWKREGAYRRGAAVQTSSLDCARKIVPPYRPTAVITFTVKMVSALKKLQAHNNNETHKATTLQKHLCNPHEARHKLSQPREGQTQIIRAVRGLSCASSRKYPATACNKLGASTTHKVSSPRRTTAHVPYTAKAICTVLRHAKMN